MSRRFIILLALTITFAAALMDGDKVAFKCLGNIPNPRNQYLNADTVKGTLNLAANTDFGSASGTWWRAHWLADGSWAFETLGSIATPGHLYLNAGTVDGSVNLAANTDMATASGTHWAAELLGDDSVGLRTLGNVPVASHRYLNGETVTSVVNLAANTEMASASGTHWEIVPLS